MFVSRNSWRTNLTVLCWFLARNLRCQFVVAELLNASERRLPAKVSKQTRLKEMFHLFIFIVILHSFCFKFDWIWLEPAWLLSWDRDWLLFATESLNGTTELNNQDLHSLATHWFLFQTMLIKHQAIRWNPTKEQHVWYDLILCKTVAFFLAVSLRDAALFEYPRASRQI